LHAYCTLQNPKPLKYNRLWPEYDPPRKRTYLNGYRGFKSLPLRHVNRLFSISYILLAWFGRLTSKSKQHCKQEPFSSLMAENAALSHQTAMERYD
jgi:hypothetical protein